MTAGAGDVRGPDLLRFGGAPQRAVRHAGGQHRGLRRRASTAGPLAGAHAMPAMRAMCAMRVLGSLQVKLSHGGSSLVSCEPDRHLSIISGSIAHLLVKTPTLAFAIPRRDTQLEPVFSPSLRRYCQQRRDRGLLGAAGRAERRLDALSCRVSAGAVLQAVPGASGGGDGHQPQRRLPAGHRRQGSRPAAAGRQPAAAARFLCLSHRCVSMRAVFTDDKRAVWKLDWRSSRRAASSGSLASRVVRGSSASSLLFPRRSSGCDLVSGLQVRRGSQATTPCGRHSTVRALFRWRAGVSTALQHYREPLES